MPWLIRLRWATVVADAAVLAAAALFTHADFPLAHLVPYVAASAFGNGSPTSPFR